MLTSAFRRVITATAVAFPFHVVREDILPADFAQPALFSSPGGAKLTINLFNRLSEASLREQLQSIAAVKTAEAEAAMKREKEARMAAAKKAAEAAPAAQALRVAEANLAKAEADLKAAERAPQTAGSRVQIAKVEAAKKQARIKFEAAQAQLKATKLQAQPKLEAASQAETDAKAADATMIGAVKGAEIAKQLREQLQSIAAVKTAEAEAAMKREKGARMAAAKKAAEAAPAAQALRVAEANLAKEEADLKAAERAPETADSRVQIAKVEAAKKQARIKFEAAQAQLKATKLQAQPKLEAAAQAETDAKAADAAMIGAVQGAEIAKQNTSPVSVFVSRKAQRLYIRKGNQPVFESPVTIRDADKPIGTFVFTALNYTRTLARATSRARSGESAG